MKTLIAAAMLLALTAPAFAYGNHSDWDCGHGIGVTSWKNQLSVTVGGDPFIKDRIDTPAKGAFSFKWSNKGMWLNGRKCLLLGDELYLTKHCAEANDYVCKELAEGWELTPDQIKRAIAKWKANWPGNTVQKP